MDNNDVLRRLRYALDLRDTTLLGYFAAAHVTLTREEVRAFLKHEGDEEFVVLSDAMFGKFLDGMVTARRGQREPARGEPPPPPMPMNNNRVLRSLRIAFELRDDDIIAMMKKVNFAISKAELSALFRRETHTHYQPCGDQFLRNFILGLTAHFYGTPSE